MIITPERGDSTEWIELFVQIMWNKSSGLPKMSQIRKSASFRSRIPVRRTKPIPRRCYSPEPYKNRSTPTMFESNHNDYELKPYAEQRISKQKMKRQRHVATTLAQNAQHTATTKPSNDTSMITAANFTSPTRPKTIYSSSSYSSSDESQESEAPPQVRSHLEIVNWVKIANILYLHKTT